MKESACRDAADEKQLLRERATVVFGYPESGDPRRSVGFALGWVQTHTPLTAVSSFVTGHDHFADIHDLQETGQARTT